MFLPFLIFLGRFGNVISSETDVGPSAAMILKAGDFPYLLLSCFRNANQRLRYTMFHGVGSLKTLPLSGPYSTGNFSLFTPFTAAESSNKWVQLCIYPGFFAPAWALKGVKSEKFPVLYGPDRGKVLRLPTPWNMVYLNRWFAFLKQLSDRYGKSPAFRIIAADGPTSVSEEMTLPNLPRNLKKWQKHSYTPSKYIGAWKKVFAVYAAGFPDQYISLAVGNGLNINGHGKIDRRAGTRTRQAIIHHARGLLGHRFILENHALHAGPKYQPSTGFVMSYSGRIITGLEMGCASELGTCSEWMGAKGNPPLALRRSIDKGMKPNKAGRHVNYLEIYEADVLADEMQPVLRYGASLFR